MIRIRPDLKTSNFLCASLIVVDADGGVDTPDNSMGHIRRPAGLHDAVPKVRLANSLYGDVEVKDLRRQATVIDGGDRAVAGHSEMTPHEPSNHVAVHPIVIVGTGLHDGVA